MHTLSKAHCCEISELWIKEIVLTSREGTKTGHQRVNTGWSRMAWEPSTGALEARRQESIAFKILKGNILP